MLVSRETFDSYQFSCQSTTACQIPGIFLEQLYPTCVCYLHTSKNASLTNRLGDARFRQAKTLESHQRVSQPRNVK